MSKIPSTKGRALSANQSLPSWIQKCTVISCPNVDDSPGRAGPGFFSFPEDRATCRVWKEKCGIASHHPVTAAKVCADHFRQIDFGGSKRKLVPYAVPRENLHWMVGAPEVKPSDLKYNKDTRRWEVVVEIKDTRGLKNSNQAPDLNEVRREVDTRLLLTQRYANLVEEEKKLTRHQGVYNRKIDSIYQTTDKIKASIEKHRGKSTMNPEESLLYKVFSQAQINFLLRRKKVVWSHDDMARAFTLRQIGNKKLYLYLKDTLNMPLPCLSSVQNWAAAQLPQ